MGNFNPPELEPNTDVVVPEGYVHYGPANAGVTLPEGTDFKDSMLLGGFMSTTGQNPYFPDGGSSGNLSLGGTPQETANPPPLSEEPRQGADSAGGDPWIITNPGEIYPGSGSSNPRGDWGSVRESVNDSFGSSGGAVTGPAAQPGNIFDAITPEKTGYESSSNKDFYQQQMQEMRATQKGQKLNELAAAMRRQEAAQAPQGEPFGGDPWSWANLPEVQMGGSAEPTPIEWGYNPSYGITEGMTNQQAAGAVSPVLGANDMALLNQLWQDRPDVASAVNWTAAGSPTGAQTAISGGSTPRSPELNDVISKVLNNVYLQTGGGTGGISVPDGYANPVNTQGV